MKKLATVLLVITSFLCISLFPGMNVTKANAASNETEYTVTFDCNGGKYNSDSTTFSQSVWAGGLATEPDKSLMKRYNCSFEGWVTSTGKAWNFDEDTVEQDFTLYAEWDWDDSVEINQWGSGATGVRRYFTDKYYGSTDWSMVSSNSTKNVSGSVPIEVKGEDPDPAAPTPDDALFPSSDIEIAIEKSGIESSYGGCGPLAMIGMLDYFARYRGYTSIMNDPTDFADRRVLAYDVFTTTKTIELPDILSLEDSDSLLTQSEILTEENYYQQMTTSSGGKKQTFTDPSEYVVAFNTLMKDKYHLDKQIVAHNQGWGLFVTRNMKINRVKQSINEGLPVTVYCGLGGDGSFGNHYANVYEYQEWQGKDKEGNTISNVIFAARLNWGRRQSDVVYMDATLFNKFFSGVIYYKVADNQQLIRPIDFADDFVNDNGQGQYFFYEQEADITTSDGFTFGTSRLRCGYIENQFLVLSANRTNAGLAYLEMKFNIDIKAINFDISFWSGSEGLGADDYVKLYYLDESGNWQEQMTFDIFRMSTLKQYPDNLYVEFQQATSGIKFEVYESTPSGDRNKGRVVIGDMNLFY